MIDLHARFPGRYVSLTSYRRDGTAIATPVWFVIDGGRLLFVTDPESLKVKRIRHNAQVTIAPCTASGRVRGEPMAARAALLDDDGTARAEALLARKYRIDRVVVLPIYRAVQRLRGARRSGARAAIAIIPEG